FTPAHTYRPFLQPPNPKPHHHYCPTNYTLKFYFFFFILSAPPLARLAPQHQPQRLQKPFDSRLARNSNRVNSLNAKLQLKLSDIHKCDLRPVETEIQPEDLSTPIISSVSQGSSKCFARIGVGTPTNQCEPCSDCYQETDPIFQPESSSSYSPLTSDSRQCVALKTSACRNNRVPTQDLSPGQSSYAGSKPLTRLTGQAGQPSARLAGQAGHPSTRLTGQARQPSARLAG
ncbi:hypothetical protein G4B88_002163, partial [Cannabis sativa]